MEGRRMKHGYWIRFRAEWIIRGFGEMDGVGWRGDYGDWMDGQS